MIDNCPFHYEVRFSETIYNKEKVIKHESFKREFRNEDPFVAREIAFETFHEYVSFFEQNGRLAKNQRGNLMITKPSFKKELISKKELNNYNEHRINIEQFKAEVSVLLVVDNDDLLEKAEIDFWGELIKSETTSYLIEVGKKLGLYDKREFDLHKVTSYNISEQDEQEMIDNLYFTELKIYDFLNFSTKDISTEVYHYGEDYYVTGEDEGGAFRQILQTPHIWQTLEEYVIGLENVPPPNKEDTNFSYVKIIQDGESHNVEFKPTLLYKFDTKKGSIAVKYVLAKAICGFLNSDGGLLFIGVSDDGNIQGLSYDYSLFNELKDNKAKLKDKMRLEVDSMIVHFFDKSITPLVRTEFQEINGRDILVLVIEKSSNPIFLYNKRNEYIEKEFYIRMNASTRQIMDMEELANYILNKNWNKE